MLTKENTKKSMRMQAAEVSRPLANVKRICEAGHVVVFDDKWQLHIQQGVWRNQSTPRGGRQLHVRCVGTA